MRVLQQISEHLLHAGDLSPEAFEALVSQGFITRHHDPWDHHECVDVPISAHVPLSHEEQWERGAHPSGRPRRKSSGRRSTTSPESFAHTLAALMAESPAHMTHLERTDWPTTLNLNALLEAVFFARTLCTDPLSAALLDLRLPDAIPSTWLAVSTSDAPMPRTALLRAPALREASRRIQQGRALWGHLCRLHTERPQEMARWCDRDRAWDLGWILGLRTHLRGRKPWAPAPYQAWAPQPSAGLWTWAWRESLPLAGPTALREYVTAQALGLELFRTTSHPPHTFPTPHLEALAPNATRDALRHWSQRMLPVAVRLARPGVFS